MNRAAILLGGLLAASGCASAGSGGAAAGPPAIESASFAPALRIDVDAMTRTPSGLYIRDLRAGTGEEARRGARVRVHYAGWLADGTQIDARVPPDQPLEFRLGEREVIRGWDEGIAGMRVGGQRQLVVPPDLGYGARRTGPIPPGSYLVFLIELEGVR